MLQYDRTCNNLGVATSIVLHAVLLAVLAGVFSPHWNDFATPVIYSVTLEGGKTLGGLSQVPKDDKEQQVAPPKKVGGEEQKELEKLAKDAEVSLAEKKKLEKEKQEEEKKLKQKKLEEEKKKKEEKKKLEEKKKKPTLAEINKMLEAKMQRYTGESTDAGGQGFGAGALGGKKMGGGVVRPPAFFTYRDLLKNHIKQGWRWYDNTAALLAIVEFEIAPDGTLDNIKLVQGSGNGQYDESVLRAVYKASPVPVPPAEVYEQFFKSVTMRFDPRE